MSRRLAAVMGAAAFVVFLPHLASAQSAITGVVKDSSGAVLPGVTVEASSEALIERVKTVVTDGQGVYRIIDLRPGNYVVSFALPGFQTVRREGLHLPSEFTATVHAEMRVGELTEAITVTGEAPVVDTTTAVHTQVLDREAIDVLPSGRMIQSIGQLVPGINLSLPDVGGARAMQQTYMSTHGMTAANNTVMVDGMTINGLQADGAVQAYTNEAMSQEMSYQTSGINADTSAGGVRLNLIPREGGNRFSGDFRYSVRPGELQADNLTQRHIDAGVQAGNAIDRIMDLTFSEGGPIKRDKLWFFFTARYNTVNTKIANTFFDDGSQATINRSYTHADYTPFTVYNPETGDPIEVFARTLQTRPTRNLDTFDPDRARIYESFNVEFSARPGRGATLFGGIAVERQLDINCTAPDDPNTLRFCNDHENGVPYRESFKLAGSLPVGWGVTVSGVLQSNHGIASSRTMAATRGLTRYPASCLAPCPAGQIILPTTVFGQSSLTVNLVDGDTVYTERINQLDLRAAKTFSFGRVRVTPSLEGFNVNNSDAVISYSSTNILNAGSSYLRPNSIMQGRMIGLNLQTRW